MARLSPVRSLLTITLALLCALGRAEAQAPPGPEALAKLVAPIALYPDPLVAQVLPASTQPLEVFEAADAVAGGKRPGDDVASKWDPSVQALLSYPSVLKMMKDKIEWTTQLGQAFAADQGGVLAAIQSVRAQAAKAGNLKSTPQQKVETKNNTIIIEPASPEVIYVPQYDPVAILAPAPYYAYSPLMTFGVGFAAGAATAYACNWGYYGGGSSSVVINNNYHYNYNNSYAPYTHYNSNTGSWGTYHPQTGTYSGYNAHTDTYGAYNPKTGNYGTYNPSTGNYDVNGNKGTWNGRNDETTTSGSKGSGTYSGYNSKTGTYGAYNSKTGNYGAYNPSTGNYDVNGNKGTKSSSSSGNYGSTEGGRGSGASSSWGDHSGWGSGGGSGGDAFHGMGGGGWGSREASDRGGDSLGGSEGGRGGGGWGGGDRGGGGGWGGGGDRFGGGGGGFGGMRGGGFGGRRR